MKPGLPKADIYGYVNQIKPHIKTMIQDQLERTHPIKKSWYYGYTTLWVRWKKTVKSVFKLHPEHDEGSQDIGDNTGDDCIKAELSLNSLITELFKDSNIEELINGIFLHIKTKAANPRMPKSDFTLDKSPF